MTDTTDRIALVSGGSGGIGAAICRHLSGAGFTVLVGYRSGADAADAVVASCAGKAEAVHLDVADGDTITAAVARAGDLGRLSVLVNNGGIADDDLLLRLDADRIDQTLAVNLRGAMLLSREALRPMLRARHGRIISISSAVALRGNVGQTLYSASKAGLIGFTKSLAREVGRKGVTVNVVAPGLVETSMTADIGDDARQHLIDLAPIARPVTTDEVAAAVAFLAGDSAGAVTGTVLPVDGGAAI